MGEVLCRHRRKYDSENDLMLQDVKVKNTKVHGEKVEFLTVRLKSTKTCRKMEKGLSIEVFQVNGPLCPVMAWKRYRTMTIGDEEELPAFRTEEGYSYSHTDMNKDLREIFGSRVNYGKVSGHSFRIGLASLLAECGYKDEGKTTEKTGYQNNNSEISSSRNPGDRKMEQQLFSSIYKKAEGNPDTYSQEVGRDGRTGRIVLKTGQGKAGRLSDFKKLCNFLKNS